jgi:hypothetical protein
VYSIICVNSTKIEGRNRGNSLKVEEIDESMQFRRNNLGKIAYGLLVAYREE